MAHILLKHILAYEGEEGDGELMLAQLDQE